MLFYKCLVEIKDILCKYRDVDAEVTLETGLNISSPILLFLRNIATEAYLEPSRISTMDRRFSTGF